MVMVKIEYASNASNFYFLKVYMYISYSIQYDIDFI